MIVFILWLFHIYYDPSPILFLEGSILFSLFRIIVTRNIMLYIILILYVIYQFYEHMDSFLQRGICWGLSE